MRFLQFLLMPQAHKVKDGYFINHDTLMSVSPQSRSKLIFYFIAQQLPSKLSKEDQIQYQTQKNYSIGLPRAFLMSASFLAPITYALYSTKGKFRQPVISVGLNLLSGALLMIAASSVFNRVYEGRFVSQNKVLDQLAKKYDFGIYDFGVAKKQSHICQLMQSMGYPIKSDHQ